MTKQEKRIIEDCLHVIILAVELYAAAGDEENSRKQYRELSDEARKILINTVSNNLRGLIE